MEKIKLISYLNEYLKIWDIKDVSQNWLQVDNSKSNIYKVWYAVDVNSYIIEMAIMENVDLLIVHHGMYWWVSETVTWIHYQRIKKLIDWDVALYGCHLPLDSHPQVGNNIGLINEFCKVFQMSQEWIEPFGNYHWEAIWYWIKFDKTLPISMIAEIYAEKLWLKKELYNFGNKNTISSICFISWGWSDGIKEANDKWFDLFVTWEAPHYNLMLARELSQSVLLWWHRETETLGVDLLSKHLNHEFWIEIVKLDRKY